MVAKPVAAGGALHYRVSIFWWINVQGICGDYCGLLGSEARGSGLQSGRSALVVAFTMGALDAGLDIGHETLLSATTRGPH